VAAKTFSSRRASKGINDVSVNMASTQLKQQYFMSHRRKKLNMFP
jgi:hypothetical protein